MLLVAGQSWREGLMICFKFNAFHYQVQVIMTISAFSFYTVVDNGPSAEIHKTVSIFLRGQISRSLSYPVVTTFHFVLPLFYSVILEENYENFWRMNISYYERHQQTYGADLNARCICGTRDVSRFTKENDFMSSWIASL